MFSNKAKGKVRITPTEREEGVISSPAKITYSRFGLFLACLIFAAMIKLTLTSDFILLSILEINLVKGWV